MEKGLRNRVGCNGKERKPEKKKQISTFETEKKRRGEMGLLTANSIPGEKKKTSEIPSGGVVWNGATGGEKKR